MVLRFAREDGGLLARLADDDALGVDDLVVFVEVDHELGNVGEDVHRTEVIRHPPPLFHVGEQLLGRAVFRDWRDRPDAASGAVGCSGWMPRR